MLLNGALENDIKLKDMNFNVSIEGKEFVLVADSVMDASEALSYHVL